LFPVPGDFRDGRNYSAFAGADACAAAAIRLVEDGALRAAQMQANADYYRRHLRPDRLVLGALEAALGHAGRPLPAPFAAAAAG
jgi:hypothetical protein